LDDAELLVGYLARHGTRQDVGIQVGDAITAVVNAKKSFLNKELPDKVAPQEVYKAIRTLTQAIEPVTVASIRASLKCYGKPVGLFRKEWLSLASVEIRRRGRQAIFACLVLLAVQAFWSIGNSLLSALPKPPADEADIITQNMLDETNSAKVESVGQEFTSSKERESPSYKLWAIRRQKPVKDLAEWLAITEPLRWVHWIRKPHQTGSKPDNSDLGYVRK
jgi:hypothetical protein